MSADDELPPWVYVSVATARPFVRGDWPVARAEELAVRSVNITPREPRTLRGDLAETVRPDLAGYITQARQRGREPAELRMARPTSSRGMIAIHCRFADGMNILIDLHPRLERALTTDPQSRELTEAACQEVYAALLSGEREARRARRRAAERIFDDIAPMRPDSLFSETTRRLREHVDAELLRLALGPAATTNVEPTEPPRAITATDLRRAMEEMAQQAVNPPTINPVFVYGARFAGVDYGARVSPRTPDAEARGMALLWANLTPAQLAQYREGQSFEVTGSATGRRYRIRHARIFNVEEITECGKRVRMLCFLPAGNLVMGDVLLAQKIALETDETAALAVANADGDWPAVMAPCSCALCRPGPRRGYVVGTWDGT